MNFDFVAHRLWEPDGAASCPRDLTSGIADSMAMTALHTVKNAMILELTALVGNYALRAGGGCLKTVVMIHAACFVWFRALLCDPPWRLMCV